MHLKTCHHCNKSFESPRPTTKYCSARPCRQAGQRARSQRYHAKHGPAVTVAILLARRRRYEADPEKMREQRRAQERRARERDPVGFLAKESERARRKAARKRLVKANESIQRALQLLNGEER